MLTVAQEGPRPRLCGTPTLGLSHSQPMPNHSQRCSQNECSGAVRTNARLRQRRTIRPAPACFLMTHPKPRDRTCSDDCRSPEFRCHAEMAVTLVDPTNGTAAQGAHSAVDMCIQRTVVFHHYSVHAMPCDVHVLLCAMHSLRPSGRARELSLFGYFSALFARLLPGQVGPWPMEVGCQPRQPTIWFDLQEALRTVRFFFHMGLLTCNFVDVQILGREEVL